MTMMMMMMLLMMVIIFSIEIEPNKIELSQIQVTKVRKH